MEKRVFIFKQKYIDDVSFCEDINLKEEYTHVRGYHGCRPINLNSYYENGILPINKNQVLEHALKVLSKEISQEKIKNIFYSHWSNLIEYHKTVWFTLIKDELTKRCGHYLIYGSEFICGMAAELRCQAKLKEYGIPTIFHCDVPIEKIPIDYLEDLNKIIKTSYVENCGFKIIGKLDKNDIVKHEHPKKVLDPLNQYRPYYLQGY